MTLSEYIKQKRKKNGLSQVELAERAGVGLRFVRELEQGKQTLTCLPKWQELVAQSFLPEEMKANYNLLLSKRIGLL